MARVLAEAVRPREPDAGLRGLVEDGVDALEDRHQVGVAEVGLDERERVVVAGRREVLPLRVGVVVRREAVDADDRVALRQQRVHEVAADESAGTGDDDASGRRGVGDRCSSGVRRSSLPSCRASGSGDSKPGESVRFR